MLKINKDLHFTVAAKKKMQYRADKDSKELEAIKADPDKYLEFISYPFKPVK